MFNFLSKYKISNPPWEYNFLLNLDEKEYPKYLAKLFYLKTGEKLPLLKEWNFKSGYLSYKINKKKLKTFNQKLQWIKLYGITDLMRDCTDKVKVRDYVREKIGDEYLKPVLQVIRSEESGVRSNNLTANSSLLTTNLFDKVDFEKLPNTFIIKCNHGCKWHYIIKNKNEYLKNKRLVDITRCNITGWLEQDYSLWGGFEMQYREIKPKIFIEPLLRDNINQDAQKLNVYCFNGIPKTFIKFFDNHKMSIWDEEFHSMENIFGFHEENINLPFDEYLNQSIDLSKKLARNFDFVRVDWMIFKNKLYFEELTFTPYSGFHKIDKKNNYELGNFLI